MLASKKYVAEEDTALSIASVYGKLADGRLRFAQFNLPPSYILNSNADLNRYVGITHWQGISGSGGYSNEVFRIVKTETSVTPNDKKLRVTAIKIPL